MPVHVHPGLPPPRQSGDQREHGGDDADHQPEAARLLPAQLGQQKLGETQQEEEGDEADEEILKLAEKLRFDENFLRRDVNLGFSGGETKRAEILQILLQNPDFILFDEPDSGVDIENVELIGEVINEMLQRGERPSVRKRSALIITHTGFIFNYVRADRAHVLLNGKIACSGIPDEIINQIMKGGFEKCIRECLGEGAEEGGAA